MKCSTARFGDIDYEDRHVVVFPGGLLGRSECREFLIVDDNDAAPLQWLVSLQDPAWDIPVMDPAQLLPELHLEHAVGPDATVYVIVSPARGTNDDTVNIREPIMIDRRTHQGAQLLLDDASLPQRLAIPPACRPARRE